jgi:gluconolactonase
MLRTTFASARQSLRFPKFYGVGWFIAVAASLWLVTPSESSSAADPIPGIGPRGPIRKVASGLSFTEGPAWDGVGKLYFTDIPNNRILRVNESGEVQVFLEPSGHCNGLMFDGAGNLLACEMDGRLLKIDLATKQIRVLADRHAGARFNAPNDLVIDSLGGIYFTDPRYRAPDPWPQGLEAVYYRDINGRVTRIIEGIQAPNGVILSPDERTLYVVPSMEENIYAYDVVGPGRVQGQRVLATMRQPAGKKGSGGDGLTVDTQGRLYVTTELGLQVFDPLGAYLGVIELPEQPANVTFGGNGQTLFVTARTGVYAVETLATGHVFRGVVR